MIYDVLKDFAGPVATMTVAVVAGYITWSYNKKQVEIARERLKLDLYEKRYEFYKTTKQIIITLINRVSEGKGQVQDLHDLKAKLTEAPFFFGPDVCDVMKQLVAFIEPLFIASELHAAQAAAGEPGPENPEITKIKALTVIMLKSGIDDLPGKFAKEMSFKRLEEAESPLWGLLRSRASLSAIRKWLCTTASKD
jgi:hypothetical protein